MGYRIGSSYFGSDDIKVSTSNQELIQQHKSESWSIPLKAYKFSLLDKFINGDDYFLDIQLNTPNSIVLNINITYYVENELKMLSLNNARINDVCIRKDLNNKKYILKYNNFNELSSWEEC